MLEMLPQPSFSKNPLLSDVEGFGLLIFTPNVQYVDMVDYNEMQHVIVYLYEVNYWWMYVVS